MKLLKSLFIIFSTLFNPILSTDTKDNFDLSESKSSLSSTSCLTKINKFDGNCRTPSSCDGGIYNNLCPGNFKCCVDDINSSPWLYWKYVSKEEFKGLFPLLSDIRINTLYPWYNKALSNILDDIIDTKIKCNIISSFSAQIAHESLDLTTFEEFASGENYEGRCKQLGNCSPGDGIKYKGRGAIQITGKSNYIKVSEYIGEDFVEKPDLLVLPSYGFKVSEWYWLENKLNQYSTNNLNDFITLTKKINGGINGLEDRINKWNRAKNVLKC